MERLSLSLRALFEENLEGGLLYWGPWRMCKGRLWRRASLSIGAPLGNLEVGSYTGDFGKRRKEGYRNGASLCEGAVWGELQGGLAYGGPRRMY